MVTVGAPGAPAVRHRNGGMGMVLTVTVEGWRTLRNGSNGRQGTVKAATLRGDRATPRCERICNFAIRPKFRTTQYTTAVCDGPKHQTADA